MFKLLGGILVAAGATGLSFCVCKDLKMQIMMLKELRYLYQLIQNEVRYTGLPMYLVFENIADKVKPTFQTMLKNVSGRLQRNHGEVLESVWKEECKKSLPKVPFTARQRESVLRFPECMGMIDKEGQAKALQYRIEELDGWITVLEKEADEKNKVIMSLGMGAGVLAVIILL